MKLHLIAAAVTLAFSATAFAQGTAGNAGRAGERDMKKAEHERIEAAYKADKAKCDAMKGNEKDVCMKEAKGKEKVAKAELDAKDSKDPAAQAKVDKAKAEAEYDVAKERCDDQKGKEKSACVEQAKAKRDQALAAVKDEKKEERSAARGTSSDTAAVKR